MENLTETIAELFEEAQVLYDSGLLGDGLRIMKPSVVDSKWQYYRLCHPWKMKHDKHYAETVRARNRRTKQRIMRDPVRLAKKREQDREAKRRQRGKKAAGST